MRARICFKILKQQQKKKKKERSKRGKPLLTTKSGGVGSDGGYTESLYYCMQSLLYSD